MTRLPAAFWEQERGTPDPDLMTAIAARVRDDDYVSLAELQRVLADRFPVEGKMAWGCCPDAAGAPTVFFWIGMSDALIDALVALLRAETIALAPASFLTYLIDGRALTLPLAKRPPKGGYKEQHWLPVTLRPGRRMYPSPQGRPRRATRG